jgi:hypothetical protein
MKRYANLWDRMISFENLLQAAHAAACGKRFTGSRGQALFPVYGRAYAC